MTKAALTEEGYFAVATRPQQVSEGLNGLIIQGHVASLMGGSLHTQPCSLSVLPSTDCGAGKLSSHLQPFSWVHCF